MPLDFAMLTVEFHDPRNPDAFTLMARGQFRLDVFEPFFTPSIRVGEAPVGDGSDFFDIELDVSSLARGTVRPTRVGPITLGVAGLTLPTPGGNAVLSGQLEIGRLGPNGVPQPLPNSDRNVRGLLTAAGGTGLPLDLRIDLDGTARLTSEGGGVLELVGNADLGIPPDSDTPLTGNAAAHAVLRIAATATGPGELDVSVEAGLSQVTLSDVTITVPGVVTLEAETVDFNPTEGTGFLYNVLATFPSLPGVSGRLERVQFTDTNGNNIPDGDDDFEITDARLSGAGTLGPQGAPLLAADAWEISIPRLTRTGGTVTGQILIDAESATIFPSPPTSAAPLTATARGLTGSLSVANGEVRLIATEVMLQAGTALRFDATAVSFQFNPTRPGDSLGTLINATLSSPDFPELGTATVGTLVLGPNSFTASNLRLEPGQSGMVRVDDLLTLNGAVLEAPSIGYHRDGGLSGVVTVRASGGRLYPGSEGLLNARLSASATRPAFEATYDLSRGVDSLSASLGRVDVMLGTAFGFGTRTCCSIWTPTSSPASPPWT